MLDKEDRERVRAIKKKLKKHRRKRKKKKKTKGEQLPLFDETLAEAQAVVLRGREKGISCPCCGQFVKLYKRKLTSDMARFICLLSRYELGVWVDIREIDVRGGDYAKLVYWDLVEQRENEDESKKDSGIWRLTDDGYDFAVNMIQVRSHAFVFNGQCEGMTGDWISIEDALGDKFDYAELMRE